MQFTWSEDQPDKAPKVLIEEVVVNTKAEIFTVESPVTIEFKETIWATVNVVV